VKTFNNLASVPENLSDLQKTRFEFVIPDLPFLYYKSQTTVLPSVNTTAIAIPTPLLTTWRHAEKLNYGTFSINAIIDEDLNVWEETYNWLKSLTKPQTSEQYIKFFNNTKSPYHDGILTTFTNAWKPNIRFRFADCHPIGIGGIDFSHATSSAESGEPIVCEFVFQYDYFVLERFTTV